MSYIQLGSPFLKAGKGCAESEGGSGCIKKRGNQYVILNNKKGGIWRDGFASEAEAKKALSAYHANSPVTYTGSDKNQEAFEEIERINDQRMKAHALEQGRITTERQNREKNESMDKIREEFKKNN